MVSGRAGAHAHQTKVGDCTTQGGMLLLAESHQAVHSVDGLARY